jgi:hypothetical protein
MTDEEKTPVPFLTCLIHESKKAYWIYLFWICAAIDILAGLAVATYASVIVEEWYQRVIGPVQAGAWDWIVSGAVFVWYGLTGFVSAAYAALAAVPGYAWGILIIITIPAAYALAVCVNRRYPNVRKSLEPLPGRAVRGVFFGGISGSVVAVLSVMAYTFQKPRLPPDWAVVQLAFEITFIIVFLLCLIDDNPFTNPDPYYREDF